MEYQVDESDRGRSEALAEIERRTGPSNFFRAMSARPTVMREYARLEENVLAPGGVSERLKELVYLAVSSVNECSYCSAHHEARARRAGITEEEIEDVRAETDYHFTEQERTALRYARELTRTCDMERETHEALDIAFQPDQQVELTLVIGLANFTNRFSNGLRLSVERNRHRTA
jgi:uncharacterized peroxidase-related enzyme